MDRLKELIIQYSRWTPLEEYVRRIETFKDVDYSSCIENSKALLESIGKEICKEKGVSLSDNSSINGIIKQTFKAFGYSVNENSTKISSALATIAQCIGGLRNEIGLTSHGKTLEEINDQRWQVDEMTKDFLLGAIELISCLLIKLAEKESTIVKEESKVLFENTEDFNQYWDEAFGVFEMGDYSYSASEILYNMDYEAYKAELGAYQNVKEEGNE